jgi:phosphatidylglycerol lysyltransferase
VSVSRSRLLVAALTLVLLAVALFVLSRALSGVALREIEAQAARIPTLALALAALLTCASYITLTLYDVLALRLLAVRVPYRTAALTSFIAFAFANTLGVSALSSGSVRLRAYATRGIGALQIASLQALCALTFVLGATSMAGLAMLLDAPRAALALRLPHAAVHALGSTLLVAVASYTLLTALRRRPLHLRSWSLELPRARYTLAQLAVSSFDLCCAAGSLYVLLPAAADLTFAAFIAAYVLALTAGLASSIPGGLGVFESTLILLLPTTPAHTLLGAVIVYRAIYYLGPFALALVLMLASELMATRRAR